MGLSAPALQRTQTSTGRGVLTPTPKPDLGSGFILAPSRPWLLERTLLAAPHRHTCRSRFR